MEKYWNALKKYKLEREIKMRKMEEIKGFSEILHRQIYFTKIFKILKMNMKLSKFIKNKKKKVLQKSYKIWDIWLKNHKMMLAEAMIYSKKKIKNSLKMSFFLLRKY